MGDLEWMTTRPNVSDEEISDRTLRRLEQVVAVDSQSDEASASVPTTPGQAELAALVGEIHAANGARVEQDAFANVLAWYPGRGALANARPHAFLVHLDTARGTTAVPRLHVEERWSGGRIRFPANPGLRLDLATFPAASAFRGHDVVHGDGESPFGLDDKLGLAQCLVLAELLAATPEADHPPLVFVARPDEEVGRNEAIVALAETFAKARVARGYTIDGIWPFEINVENFHAAGASVTFAPTPARALDGARWLARIGGVNTHGATAAAEGHRPATRLAAEWRAAVAPEDAVFVGFVSDERRDCDALVGLVVAPGAEDRVRAALAATMEEHLPRGASFAFEPDAAPAAADGAVEELLAFLQGFYASDPGFTLPAEASSGRDGYTQPYRARPTADGLRLDLRVRDFVRAGLDRRIEHARGLAGARPFTVVEQYANMGERLAAHPELAGAAQDAAWEIGVPAVIQPIRGGTGVDPFLDRGIPVANLGTGYFAPESEKELTSRQMMAAHVRWLFALVQQLR